MRIDSAVSSNASITGSFSGSFTGVGNFVGLTADSVEFANVSNKPTLVSGSGQISYGGITDIPSGIVSSSAQIDALFDIDGLVSGSSLSSAAQGEVALTINGVAQSAVDLGLQTSDSPTFAGATVNGNITVTGTVDGRDVAADGTKLDTVEENADVTDTANVTAAGALMDSEVTSLSGIKSLVVPDSTTISSFGASLIDDADAAAALTTLGLDTDLATLSVPASTTISSFGASLIDDANASDARTTLGVDAAGTDNSTDVTLVTTSHDYLSLSGQAITLGTIDISDDTNFAVSDTSGQTGINLTLSGDTLSGVVSGLTTTSNVTFATLTTTGNATIEGNLTVEGTTTTVNTATLSVEDNMIYLNSGSAVTNPDLGFAGNYNDGTYAHAGIFSDASDAHTFKVYKGYTPEPDASAHIDTSHGSFAFADFEAAGITANGNITVTGTVDGRDIASDGSKLDGIEANAKDDQTITAGTGLSGGGTGDVTLSHADTSTQASVNNSGRTFIQDITLDDFGHVTGITSATDADTYVGTVTSHTVTAGNGLTGGGTVTTSGTTTLNVGAGTGIAVAADAVSLSHLGFQNLTDPNADRIAFWDDSAGAFAWLTAGTNLTISGTTINATDTNTTYTAGTNITLSGTQFSIPTTTDFQIDSIGVGTAAPGTTGVIRATNDIVAYYSSDERLKDNITTLDGALEKVNAMRGVEFDWNDKQEVHEGHDIGVVAQEVQAQYPELVHERDNGYLAVDYVKLTGVLLQAINELSAKVAKLENK